MQPSEEKKEVQINIQNQVYKFSSSLETAYIEELAQILNERINEVKQTYPNINKLQSITLASLNLVDEIRQIQEFNTQQKEEQKNFSNRSNQLIDLLDFGMIGDSYEL